MIVSPLWARLISVRSAPAPLSAALVTVSVLGTSRLSSASSASRRPAPERVTFGREEANHMTLVLSGIGLRRHNNAIAAGAQTERRGVAWPVGDRPNSKSAPATMFQDARASTLFEGVAAL